MNEQFCPQLLDETVILEEEDKVLFLIPSKPDWIVADRNVAELLRLCNGQNSVSDIRNILSAHNNIEDAISLLERLYNDNFFNKNESSARGGKKIRLNSVHLNMTEKCNLKCIYCYAEERNNSNKNRLSIDDYFSLIDKIYNINKDAVITFTGGEPLLNDLTVTVAEYCKSKNLGTFLLTNGILINDANAKLISSLFDTIRISIDGYTEDIHDKHRGTGSYKKVMSALNALEKQNVFPGIAMTVTNKNAHEIQGMAQHFGNRLTFQPLYEVGNARNRELGISGTEYFEALKKASGVEPYGQIARKLASLKNRGCRRCAIGEGEISISPTGDVYPCHMLHVEQFCAGNIKNKSFWEIYEQAPLLKSMRELSVETRVECQDCPLRLLCGGGCWARAFYAHGDLNAADDFCEYEILAFKAGLLQF